LVKTEEGVRARIRTGVAASEGGSKESTLPRGDEGRVGAGKNDLRQNKPKHESPERLHWTHLPTLRERKRSLHPHRLPNKVEGEKEGSVKTISRGTGTVLYAGH